MLPTPRKELGQILKKIPLFNGLSPTQIQKLLGISTLRSNRPEKNLCENNTSSDEMYILLSGELAIITADGLQVARLAPITAVGEIGVITQQPRSATVTAIQPSRTLVIPKPPFDHLLRADRDMQTKIYQNIIEILSTKLINDNLRMRDYLIEKARFEGRFKEQAHRCEIALDLAVEKGGLARAQAELHIVEKMNERSSRIPDGC